MDPSQQAPRPSILKFGGSSVATTDYMLEIAKKIAPRARANEPIVIVVSAMGKSTDTLVSLAKSLAPIPPRREMDLLLSTGEQVSIALMAMALNSIGLNAMALTGFQAGIQTDDCHTKARIRHIDTDRIRQVLASGAIAVVAGFQGMTSDGDITTLGRGGSDTTAVSLAAALNGNCEIYTDVDGVYSIDPRLFPRAKKHTLLAYDEMLEMASTGAKIMETRAIEVGHHYKVPLFIGLNDMQTPGTWIVEDTKYMERKAVTGLSISTNCLMTTLVNLPNDFRLIARIFASLADHGIIVDMISQTAPMHEHMTLSFTTSTEDEHLVSKVLTDLDMNHLGAQWCFDAQVAKLSVVGIGMVSQSGVAAKIFNIFAAHAIPYYQVTTSEISISYTVPLDLHQMAVTEIALAFDL